MTVNPVDYPLVRSSPLAPPPTLASLRGNGAVRPVRQADGEVSWLVTSYALVRAVLNDPRFSIAPAAEAASAPAVADYLSRGRGGNLLVLDGAEHRRARGLQTRYFTVARAQELRPRLDAIVNECLERMAAGGSPAELVNAYAFPVHSLAVGELLGLPHADIQWLEERRPQVVRDRELDADVAGHAVQDFSGYLRRIIADKRTCPTDGVISGLAATGELSDEDIVMAATHMSGTATANTIALAALALLAERDRWEALASNPAALDAAVKELLRSLGAFQIVHRTALEDIELADVKIKRGDSVIVSLVGANHDPDRFPDPDRIDLSRDANGHVAFGYGPHICIGQQLARVELEVALAGLLRRFPTLRLAVPLDRVETYGPEHGIYGVRALPVEW
jgi:cytochrome P450